MPKITPLMQQYLKLKKAYKDCVLLFQMGDFYECFYEDAHILAKELGLTLTSREKGENAAPMAGFPIKALDTHLPKLVQKGYKVAIANQVEDPRFAKGLVDRKVVEVVTAGTLTSEDILTLKENNYVAAILYNKNGIYLAIGDLLTSHIYVATLSPNEWQLLKEILLKEKVKEVIVLSSDENTIDYLKDVVFLVPTMQSVSSHVVEDYLNERFLEKKHALGLNNKGEEFVLYLLLSYFEDTKQTKIDHFTIKRYEFEKYLQIDPTTLRNLDIFENNLTRSLDHSLLGVIDKTMTPMGGRLLRQFLLRPLTDRQIIEERLYHVEQFVQRPDITNKIRSLLNRVYDIERLTGLLAMGRIKPRQLVMLKNSLIKVLEVLNLIKDSVKDTNINTNLKKAEEFIETVDEYIVEEPAQSIGDGEVIKSAVDQELKNLRELAYNSNTVLEKIFEKERQKTGIEKLKVGFNKVFGYYLEVPKGQLSKVPDYFIRKQTLVNAERFITAELKELEEKIITAQERIIELETKLYASLLEKLQQYVSTLFNISNQVAYWDVINTFSYIAHKYDYTKPSILDDNSTLELELINARHPVVEQYTQNFIKNSIKITKDKNFVILTGPNMGGKSTFIRQVALIQLLAQIGSFVPAKKASVKLRDKIFARVGASDDITTGRSTFMVEMAETAYILNNATSKSLIILDEIGRGTSTHEGFALAYGISKYIKKQINALTFFATHFHELTQLEDTEEGFINYKVDVLEEKDNVYFLYTVSQGRADKSYGLYVAKLVGLPESILKEAQNMLLKIMQGKTLYQSAYQPVQLSLEPVLSDKANKYKEIIDRLRAKLNKVDINNITPIQALNILDEIVREIGKEQG